jgi:hypothetical protein
LGAFSERRHARGHEQFACGPQVFAGLDALALAAQPLAAKQVAAAG